MTERPEEEVKEKDLTNQVPEDKSMSTEEPTETTPEEGTESVDSNVQSQRAEADGANAKDDEPLVDQEDDEDESDRMISESEDSPNVDYSSMDKEKLLQAARDANNHSPREAIRRIQEIRSYYFDLLQQQKKDAFEKHIEEG